MLDPLPHLRAALLAVALALWTAAMIPVQAMVRALGSRLAWVVPGVYHRGVCRLIGLEVLSHGAPIRDRPALYVANHASYLDISVLLTLVKGSFVAKAEVAGWPVFGLLARLAGTVFVDRRPSRSHAPRTQMRARLEAGDRLILFPEGTSTDGNRVLPFNSTFFGVVEQPIAGRVVPVQPISIAYTRYNNLPMRRRERPFLAWYGGMGMIGHLWWLLCDGPATVEVAFHAPLTIADHPSRKILAADCQRRVHDGVSRLLAGRPLDPEAGAPAAGRCPN